ncbi:PKD domain-containing protein [Bdellovibrio sp. 22V]|uniref:PKD domain-containing protein n=1 Tax=Bdellovibrio TaxID=958 RepID=UPI00254311AA|nr:PKD domain-containing protein [Bdellovibrio sp. 22V]WII73324.1 PKD domain-containing protein [Bdellovibrio sp. 22V]
MNKKILLVALGLCALTAGCSKSPEAGGELELTSGNSALSCTPGSEKVGTEGLSIQGNSVSQAGESVSYRLNKSLSCDGNQQVVWKTVGGSTYTATSVNSTFNKAGTYIVTAKIEDGASSSQEVAMMTTVVSDEVVVSGPQVGVVNEPVSLQLAVPSHVTLYRAIWNFGDGSPTETTLQPVQHTFTAVGTYQVKVEIAGDYGNEKVLTHTIEITEAPVENCTMAAAISGPSEAKVDSPIALSIYMPQCLADKVTSIKWTMGDGGTASGQSIQHTYGAKGTYAVEAVLYSSDKALFTLEHSVLVTEKTTEPEPEPTPTPTPEPLACSVAGQTRESHGEIYSETASCGIDGTKEMSYRDLIKEECKLVGETLKWVEVSRTKETTHEGTCEGQSCRLPDGTIVPNGTSHVLYSTQTPAGSCATVSQTRVCTNGVLSGSESYNQRSCHNGCGDFGSHGTVKTNVVTGEISIAKTCAYGETGIFDIFEQVSDQACVEGQIVTSNTHQGNIKTPGVCPTYKYAPTDNFTACSADCGGKQSRIFVCVDDKGTQVDAARCAGLAYPIEERLCDGNPEAVRRQESSVAIEEANSSQTCPANQIGVVVNKREVTTVKTYACIDHQVQLEGQNVIYGAWVSESYCRDYVAHRCSHDSLSNSEAQGRYEWMVKCQDQLPIIKEFLVYFEDVQKKKGNTSYALDSKGQHLYPSFMNRATVPEKPWIAPKKKSAPCEMPSTVYVATVCVSSCATPEQQILAQAEGSGKLQYVPFVEALTKNYMFVASLQSAQSMGSKDVQKTRVDQWVTELIDSEHDILVFKMKSGRELRVTPNHPLVASNGFMRLSQEFKVGDDLVQVGGILDPIVSITPIKYFGKVYNVYVKSNAIHHNIIVLNGYLNGSAYFQNAGAKDLNRSLFRKTLTRGAF